MEEQLTIMSTSFNEIKSNVLAAMAIVAPIAVAIIGIIIIWSFAVNFFKRIGK